MSKFYVHIQMWTWMNFQLKTVSLQLELGPSVRPELFLRNSQCHHCHICVRTRLGKLPQFNFWQSLHHTHIKEEVHAHSAKRFGGTAMVLLCRTFTSSFSVQPTQTKAIQSHQQQQTMLHENPECKFTRNRHTLVHARRNTAFYVFTGYF